MTEILIRLPEPDLANPDTWTCRLWTVKTEPALPGGELTIWLDGEPLDPDDAYELGHSLIAAVLRTKETAALPPERASTGLTGDSEGSDTGDPGIDALQAAIRTTGISVQDIDPDAIKAMLGPCARSEGSQYPCSCGLHPTIGDQP